MHVVVENLNLLKDKLWPQSFSSDPSEQSAISSHLAKRVEAHSLFSHKYLPNPQPVETKKTIIFYAASFIVASLLRIASDDYLLYNQSVKRRQEGHTSTNFHGSCADK